ncbi:MAG: AsmA family protein [Hyphomicrobiales bacterium]|nr:AsmA family protein [Hyphomicrobiales bacterium]OQW84006.1 MAG: hypothetical protein BVN31_04375 [Proteobacteria bacterium ST_bin15]
MAKFAGVGIAVVGGLFIAGMFLPTDAVRRAVAVHISAISGQTVTVNGPARLSLLPAPSVSVSKVEVGGANGGANVLEAERITARLSLIGLMLGRIEITGLKFTQPRFALLVDVDGRANWRSGASLLSLFVPGDDAETSPRLGDVAIDGGQLIYRDERARRRGEINDIDVDVTWPLIGSSLSAGGTFRLRGETISFGGKLERPAALFRKDISPFALTLDTKAIRAKLTGNALAGRDVQFESQLTFSSPSLKLLAGWLAPEVENVPDFGPVDGTSRITVVDRLMTLDKANIKIAGSRGEGTVSFGFGATRTSLQGTMDFDTVEAQPLLNLQIPTVETGAGSHFNGARLGPLDVDMRLSVANLKAGAITVQKAALSFFAREGRVEASIADGTIFGGRISGRLAITALGDKQARAQAIIALANIQVDDAQRAILGTARLTGVGSLNLDLTGEGGDNGEILRSLKGDGKLRLLSGVVQGFDLTSLARRPDRSAGEVLADSRGGRTSIESATASFRIANGVAATDDALIRGTGYRVALRGEVDPGKRTINFDGAISPQIGNDLVRALELPFSVRGPWFEPVFSFGSEGFVRRPAPPPPAP